MGADIVVAEGQSIGNGLNFGGPYVGLFATRDQYVRQMPGRLVGETTDVDGKRGWVLTLSTASSISGARRRPATSARTRGCVRSPSRSICRCSAKPDCDGWRGSTMRAPSSSPTGLAMWRASRWSTAASSTSSRCGLSVPAAPVVEALAARRILGGGTGQPGLSRCAGARKSAAGRRNRDHHAAGHRRFRTRARGGAVMDRSQGRVARLTPDNVDDTATVSGHRGLMLEEKLIFEQDAAGALRRRSSGAAGGDEPARRARAQAADRPARPVRAAGGAPLHQAQPA